MSIHIDTDFPGANIIVEEQNDAHIRLHQDLGETSRDWFYWNFKVQGAAGKRLCFEFTKSRAIGVHGPAVSNDGGVTWRWLGSDVVDSNSFHYEFGESEQDVHFCFAIPYQWSDWQAFYTQLPAQLISEHELCTTRHGRSNKYYQWNAQAASRHRLFISARHHCCEMMVNFVIEGFLQTLLMAEDDTLAGYLRDHVDLLLIPFVDLDGAEEGDQGKGREPRDHGRDYVGESVWPDTAAIRQLIPDWGIPELLIDLHCPWIAGSEHECIFQVGSDHEPFVQEQLILNQILEEIRQGPLPFYAKDYLAFGESWNTEANRQSGSGGIHRWDQQFSELRLGTTFEFPYANVHDQQVSRENCRLFGVDLLHAVARYLQRA